MQRKTNGVKAVVTLSSSVAQMGRVSEAARALHQPLAPFDRFQFAYKVSKTGLNQGAGCSCRVSGISARYRKQHMCGHGRVCTRDSPLWRSSARASHPRHVVPCSAGLPHPALMMLLRTQPKVEILCMLTTFMPARSDGAVGE